MILSRGAVAAAVTAVLLLPGLDLPQAKADPASPPVGGAAPTRPADPFALVTESAGPTEILVKYRTTGPAADFRSSDRQRQRELLNKRVGAVAVRAHTQSGIEVVELEPGVDLDDALREYEQDPAVVAAEPNHVYSTQAYAAPATPDDTHFARQWALRNTGQTGGRADADIDAPGAWRVTTGSRTVVVVVIDTGIARRHPDLAGNIWTNPGEIPRDGIDNDRNGYVDDLHGYDVVDGDGSPDDPNGHGTHVAGTIGALGGNGIGVAGVAWRVKIASCRAFDESGQGTTDQAIACLDYVQALRRSGVNVVATNNSWSGVDASALLRRAIRTQRDVLFVAAAGNDAADLEVMPAYPAGFALPNIISVAATDDDDRLADFSNRGRGSVGLSAPGVDIVSLRSPGTDIYGDGEHFVPEGDPAARYYLASGTSMAAPHVAGTVALLKARYPGLRWSAVRNRILAGGDAVPAQEGSTITGRRLNAYGALTCSRRRVLATLGAAPEFPLPPGQSVTFRVLNINCGDPAGPVTATTSTGARFPLRDDGAAPDLAAGDGLYAATFVPASATESITFRSGTRSAMLPGITFSRYLPQAQTGVEYRHALRPLDGVAPYRWTVVDGTLPAGLTLDVATGVISGTPTAAGRALVQLRLEDARGRVAVAPVGVSVVADSLAEKMLAEDLGELEVIPQDHAVDADGNTVVVGYYVDPETRDEDFAVTKYGPGGTVLWSRLRQSGTAWWANWARAVATDDAGNIYVAGGYPYFRSDSDFLLVKYDPDGNELWATSYSKGAVELPSGLTIDEAGDVVVTGTSSLGGESEVLTTKFHPSGELVWARTFQVGVLDRGAAVDTDPDGNIYVAGGSGYVFSASGSETSYSHTYLVLKYSPSGDLAWSRYDHDLDQAHLQVAETIAVDDAGNSYLGGPLGGRMHKYDTNGELVWDAPATTEHDFDIRDLDLTGDGEVVVAGSHFDQAEGTQANVLASMDAASGAPQWVRRINGDFNDSGMDVSVDATDLIRVTVPSDRGVVLTSFRSDLAITTAELTPALRGEEYRERLRARGGVRPISWQVTAGALPNGLTLDPATGVVAGLPPDGGQATFTVTVTAADGITVSKEYTLDVAYVAIDRPPGLGPLLTDQPWQLALSARGTAAPFTWSVADGELPPGVTLDPTGVLSGTPTTTGSYPVTIAATGTDGRSGTMSITLRVVEPLTIVTTTLPDGVAGSPYRAPIDARGGTPPYSWGWWGDPVPGLEINLDTGELSGVPTAPGTYQTGVFVFDGTGAVAFQALTLVVS